MTQYRKKSKYEKKICTDVIMRGMTKTPIEKRRGCKLIRLCISIYAHIASKLYKLIFPYEKIVLLT